MFGDENPQHATPQPASDIDRTQELEKDFVLKLKYRIVESKRGEMGKHTLFVLKPGFYDSDERPFYCPHSAAIEGILKYLPEIEEKVDLRRINFQD